MSFWWIFKSWYFVFGVEQNYQKALYYFKKSANLGNIRFDDFPLDIWMGDIELTTAVLVFSIIVLLPIQLLLCFRIKSKVIRLLPIILLSIPTLIFIFMSTTTQGWDGLGYVFLAIFTGFMMLNCGVAWGIWAIIKRKQKKK